MNLLGRLHEVSWGYTVDTVCSLRGVAARLGLPILYPILVVPVWAMALWVISKVNLSSGVAVGVFTSLLTGYHVGDYDYTLAWIPMALMLAKGGWLERVMVGIGLCWVLGMVLSRGAVVPFYAFIWVALMAMLLRQALPFRKPADETELSPSRRLPA